MSLNAAGITAAIAALAVSGVTMLDVSSVPDQVTLRDCPVCHGQRLRQESLSVTVKGKTIGEYVTLPISEALVLFDGSGDGLGLAGDGPLADAVQAVLVRQDLHEDPVSAAGAGVDNVGLQAGNADVHGAPSG